MDGTEKICTDEIIYFLHFSVRVCTYRLGAVPANSWQYQHQVPGGLNYIYFDQQKLTTPLRTIVQPESLNALNDDIQQERRVWQQHRTESLETRNGGISTRRYVCQSLVGSTMYSIDYTHYLSTPSLKCPTTGKTTTY